MAIIEHRRLRLPSSAAREDPATEEQQQLLFFSFSFFFIFFLEGVPSFHYPYSSTLPSAHPAHPL